MKVILERLKCIGCGSCAALCSKHFELAEDGKAHIKESVRDEKTGNDELLGDNLGCIREAADSCPAEIISIIEKA